MKIEIVHHVRFDPHNVRESLCPLLFMGEKLMSQLQSLQDAVARIDGVTPSVISLLQTLSQQLADAKENPAAVQALADDLNSRASALADAVTTFTPAPAPAPEPAPEPNPAPTTDPQPADQPSV